MPDVAHSKDEILRQEERVGRYNNVATATWCGKRQVKMPAKIYDFRKGATDIADKLNDYRTRAKILTLGHCCPVLYAGYSESKH